MWSIAINGQETITYQGTIDEINLHQTPCGKYKVNISLCRRKIHQITDLEYICSRFDQVRPVVSNIEVRLPKESPTPNNIGKGLKGPQRKFWKEYLFFQYENNKIVSIFQLSFQSNNSLKEKNPSVSSLILLLRKVAVIMYGNVLHVTVKMVFLVLKVFIFIDPTVQGHMLIVRDRH